MGKEILWKQFDELGDDIIGIMLLGYCDLVATRKLLNPLEDNGVIKTYMEFILTNYFYRYKTDMYELENVIDSIKSIGTTKTSVILSTPIQTKSIL